jgi:hypothetical protein
MKSFLFLFLSLSVSNSFVNCMDAGPFWEHEPSREGLNNEPEPIEAMLRGLASIRGWSICDHVEGEPADNDNSHRSYFCQLFHESILPRFVSDDDFAARLVNVSNERGETALHYAAERGNIDACRYLLSRGANCNSITREGKTPLYIASECNQQEVCDLLLRNNAILGCATVEGKTPLHVACERKYKQLAKFLIAKGADENAKTLRGRTPKESLLECTICTSVVNENGVKINGCEHTFHRPCINSWLERQKDTCPTCRGQVNGVEDIVFAPTSGQDMSSMMRVAQDGSRNIQLLVDGSWHDYSAKLCNYVKGYAYNAVLVLGVIGVICVVEKCE